MIVSKILFYTHGLVDGGAERLWSCLASAFHQRGYDVVFVQDFEGAENRDNLDPAIPLTTLGKGHFQAVRKLAEVLKREQPDVCLSAVGGSNTKLLAAIALSRSKTKPIITYHGFEEWKTGLLSLFTYMTLPVLSRLATRTVAVSDGLREELIRKWRAYPSRIVTIHNPVFFPPLPPLPTYSELTQRDEVLLAVGRMVPQKDYLTLIRAFARLRRRHTKLLILGKGPDREKIEAEIARLGVGDRVSMPGYTPEPWKEYARAKCFVLSSRSEPFGNVVVEALAYGLPVVATAADGPLEILKHGEFGKIVPVGDHVQLAAAIEATLDAPGDPAPRRGRAEEFSFDVRVPAYERLVAEVLGTASAPFMAEPQMAAE